MNIKRILYWAGFAVVLILIIWGLIAAFNKAPGTANRGTPAPVTAADNIKGPENAPVTMIEYSDFQCPACAAYAPLVERIFAESSSTLRIIYRNYPLPQHLNAIPAAQAAQAAAKQGRFWEMHDLLFQNQPAWENSKDPETIFSSYAQRLGLNMSAYESDYKSAEVADKIKADRDSGIAIGINATPTFFVNGKAISNPNSYEEFKTIIQSAAQGSTR